MPVRIRLNMSYEISGKEFRDGRGGKKDPEEALARHSSEGWNPVLNSLESWIPAFAGMTACSEAC
jgi:hypothetical protein